MKIGVALPHYGTPDKDPDLQRVVDIARECERLGFDSVWVSDHIVFDLSKYGGSSDPIGSLEPLETLAVLANATSRVRLGTMVLCNEFRHPVQLARSAVAIDLASHGRLELGIGAGWYEEEFDGAGIEFPPPGVRLDKLGEAVEVLKAAFTGEAVTYAGKHYKVTDLVVRPRPAQNPRPTIWVGGKGDRAIRLAGRVGDGWNAAWFSDPAAYQERAGVLRDAGVRRSIGQYAHGSPAEMADR